MNKKDKFLNRKTYRPKYYKYKEQKGPKEKKEKKENY